MPELTDYKNLYDLSNPLEMAEACAHALRAEGKLAHEMGMSIKHIAPGYAQLSMEVQQHMLNGHETCHGGAIFTLADSTFGFASNSENIRSEAANASIEYISPAFKNDVLIATAIKIYQRSKAGVFDVRVENQKSELIALFRGRAHRVSESIIPGTLISEGNRQ